MRIASGGLVFSGILRQADFTGRISRGDGGWNDPGERRERRICSSHAGRRDCHEAGAAAAGGAPVPSLTGSLERVVATGHVDIDQPGLQATGERLVYTASDQVFLLTGDARTPPQATDAQGHNDRRGAAAAQFLR